MQFTSDPTAYFFILNYVYTIVRWEYLSTFTIYIMEHGLWKIIYTISYEYKSSSSSTAAEAAEPLGP
jgi:hypothetical protein